MSDRFRQDQASEADSSSVRGPGSTVEERLAAVERALTDSDRDLTEIETAAERDERIDDLESRLAEIEAQVADLEAAMQAVRGYVGAIRAVNRDVERRADAALAAAQAVEPADGGRSTNATDLDRVATADGGQDDASTRDPGEIDASAPEGTDLDADPLRTADRPALESLDPTANAGPGSTESSGGSTESDDAEAGDWPWETDATDEAPTEHGFEPVEAVESVEEVADDGGSTVRGSGLAPSDDGDAGWRIDRDDPEDRVPSRHVDEDRDTERRSDRTNERRNRRSAGGRAESRSAGEGTDDATAERSGQRKPSGEPPADERRAEQDRSDWRGSEAPDPPRSPGERTDSNRADGGGIDRRHPDRNEADGESVAAGYSSGSGSRGRSQSTTRDAGDGGFDWPPGDGLDVDCAQPWSAPDVPPAEAPEEDQTLLERLREAL